MITLLAIDNTLLYLCENIIILETMRQTIIRMSESLYQRIKQNAKRERRSVNNYLVSILEKELPEEFPRLDPADFAPDEELLSLGKALSGVTTNPEGLDDKAKYILSK